MAVSPDSSKLYVSGTDSTVYVVNTAKNLVVASGDLGATPAAIALNKDGSLLLTKSADGKVRTFDARTLEFYSAFDTASAADLGSTAFVGSPDGQQAYTLTNTGFQVISLVPHNDFPTVHSPDVDAPNTAGVVTGRLTATDSNGDTLTYTATKPTYGTVVVNPDGSFTYTPTAVARHAAAGTGPTTDMFTMTIDDGRRGILTQDITVSIAPANIAPTGKSSVGSPNSTTGVVIGTITATDKDKDVLTYTVGAAANGGVTIDAKGKFTYTPTAAARHAAAAGGPVTDTFTVTADDGHGGTSTLTVTVKISAKNTKPTVTASVSQPDTNTGVVTVQLTSTDPDGDTVTFTDGSTTKGSFTVTGTTLTYTPTQAARDNAAKPGATSATKSDTLTVTFTDEHGGTGTVSVKVAVAPTVSVNPQPTTTHNLGTVTIAGDSGQVALSPDGKHAVVLTTNADGSSAVSVLNADTGARVGSTITFTAPTDDSSGVPPTRYVQFNSTSTRAIVTVDENGTGAGALAVFDTATGAQVGSTIDAAGLILPGGGGLMAPVLMSPDGTRGIFASVVNTNNVLTSRANLLNLTTGALMYQSDPQNGLGVVTLSTDGTRAALATYIGTTSTATFLNAITGVPTGVTITTGAQAQVGLNADGSRAVVSWWDSSIDPVTHATVVTSTIGTFNATTGDQIGGPLTVSGYLAPFTPEFSTDGSRAAVTLMNYSGPTATYQSALVLVNTATGAQVGSTVTATGIPESWINGQPTAGARFIAGGSRVVLGTFDASGSTQTGQVAVINALTGDQIASTASGTGVPFVSVSADGRRVATVSLLVDGSSAPVTADIALMDTASGSTTHIAQPGTLAVALNADGTRLAVASTDGTDSFVSFFDATTGAPVGTAVNLGSVAGGGVAAINVYGDRAVVATVAAPSTSSVAFFDTRTGTQLGTTVTVPAGTSGPVSAAFAGLLAQDANHVIVLSGNPDGTSTDATLVSLT